MLIKICKILAVLLIGFAGGAITPWALCWIKITTGVIETPSDAVAIANTYIVFTTIIFVGVTVILAIVGYVFTQQFSETKESQLSQVTDELKEKAETQEKLGIALINAMLKNKVVQDHFDKKLQEQVRQILQEIATNSKKAAIEATEKANQATEEANAIVDMSSYMNENGE